MKRQEAELIAEAFELIFDACMNIRDYRRCEDCPLWDSCLEKKSVMDFAEDFDEENWRDFLEFSDNASYREEDRIAQHADFMRKYIAEERWIDENDG